MHRITIIIIVSGTEKIIVPLERVVNNNSVLVHYGKKDGRAMLHEAAKKGIPIPFNAFIKK